jgi:hypothetical protein
LFLDGPKRGFLLAVQLGDAAMRRKRPRVAADRFDAELAALSMRGAAQVRRVYRHVRPKTDSFTETQTRLLVWDAGFPVPEVNFGVLAQGQRRFLDLAWVGRQTALEYQGGQHFTDPEQAREDLRRRRALQAAGWTIIEVTHEDILNPMPLITRSSQARG